MATTETVASMPDRPLTKTEVLSMEARAYCIDPDADEAYGIVLYGDEQVHGLGYDADAGGWVRFVTERIENSDEEFIDAFEDTIFSWADDHFGDRLGDDGDLSLIEGGDTSNDDGGDGERDVPREVEMGLEPEYDCPDCEYDKTGLTTGPHAFLDHLQDEHGYSRGEAFEILNG